MDDAIKNLFKIMDDQCKKDMRINSDKPKVEKFSSEPSIIDRLRQGDIKGDTVGEFFITADFGEKERREKAAKKYKRDERNKQRAYKLLAKKEYILKRLATMDLHKKKHIDEVADLNYKLEMIDWELMKIKEESGFDYMEIQKGSRIQKLLAYVNKKFKKFKKFVSKNWSTIQSVIIGVGSVIAPILFGIFAGRNKPAAA